MSTRPAPFDLTATDLALLAAGDTAALLAAHPTYAGWRVVIRGGHCEPTRRAGRAPRPGKQVLPARPGETAWTALLRLGAQAALNGCRVLPLDGECVRFQVSSQQPGDPPYLVHCGWDTVCNCTHGRLYLFRPCAHIGAVYFWLLAHRAAGVRDGTWEDLGDDRDPAPADPTWGGLYDPAA